MAEEKRARKDDMDDNVMGLDDNPSDAKLKLVAQEGDHFTVPEKVAKMSELVKTMIEGGMLFASD